MDAYANELTGLAREDRRELSPLQLAINKPPPPHGRDHDPDLGAAAVRAARARGADARGRLDGGRGHRLARPGGARAAREPRLRGRRRPRRPARRARAAPARRRGARRARRRLPRQDRDAHRRHARGRGDPAARGGERARCTALLGAFAASLGARNPTADAVHGQLAGSAPPVRIEVPFSSRWKWSGIAFGDGSELVLGAPEVLVRAGDDPQLAHEVGVRQDQRLRVLLFGARAGLAEPEGDGEPPLPGIAPLALVALSERMRPDAATTVAYLHRAGVDVKIISGDGPATVAAVARAAGIDDRRARDDGRRAAAGGLCAAAERARQHRLRARAARAQAPARRGASARRPARRHGRRRRQRRARAQGVRRRGGARLGQPARQGRRRRRARERELRGDPVRDRGGPQDPPQRAARGQAVRRQVGVRRGADPDRRRRRRLVSVPAAPALAGRRAHGRHPRVPARARARGAGAAASAFMRDVAEFAIPAGIVLGHRRAARPRARAHLDRPLGGGVARPRR